MEFCDDCDNMLNIMITQDDGTQKAKLSYNCNNCNKVYVNTKPIKDNCVYSIDYDYSKIRKENIINKYTYMDNTLPRVNNIKCPNTKCPSKTPEIVYLKYDEDKMKFIYICCECQKAKNESFSWIID
jgi:DNA-directed RNA polymerase subunit M/transcription elongation factor TFIIS